MMRLTRMTAPNDILEDRNTHRIPAKSPWGMVQHSDRMATGIISFSTASHGGIKLDRKRNAAMPARARRAGGWYEEDCEAALVVIRFPDAFCEDARDGASKIARDYFPDEYTEITGEACTKENSRHLAEIAFTNDNIGKFVVHSARRDESRGCSAIVMARKLDEEGHVIGRAEFRVPDGLYKARSEFGFVIDESDLRQERIGQTP